MGFPVSEAYRKLLLDTQVRTPGSNVASISQTIEKDPGSCTGGTERTLE